MKVKVLRGFCLGKGVDVQPGDTIDLSDREAKLKIKQGKVRDASIPEKVRQTGGKKQPAKPLLYPVDEAIKLISMANSVEEIQEILADDERPEVLLAAEDRAKELEGGKA